MEIFEEHRDLDLDKIRGTTKQIKPVRLRQGEQNLTKIVGHIKSNQAPFNLTGYKVRFAYINTDGGRFFSRCDITDPEDGIVEYTVGIDLSEGFGTVNVAYFEVVSENGVVTTDAIPIMIEENADITDEDKRKYKNELDKLIEEYENLVDSVNNELASIITDEETRKANEVIRVDSENQRVKNEDQRIKNENARQSYYNSIQESVSNGDFNGATYTPYWEDTKLAFTNDRGFPNPSPVDLKGERGSWWFIGTDVDKTGGNVEGARDYDVYLNSDTADVFHMEDGLWIYKFTIIGTGEGGGEVEVKLNLTVEFTSQPANGSQYLEGERVTFTASVSNTSIISVYNLNVNVSPGVFADGSNTTTIEELRPGASEQYTGYLDITQDSYGKQLRFHIMAGNALVQQNAYTAYIPVPARDVSLTGSNRITTTGAADNGDYYIWDTVQYDIALTNSGNITINNVEVTEQLANCKIQDGPGYTVDSANKAIIDKILPAATVNIGAAYVINETDLGRFNVINRVQVVSDQTAVQILQSEPFTVSDEYLALLVNKAITSTGTGEGGKYREGDVIRYAITVENKGAKTFSGVTVTEELPGCKIVPGVGYTIQGDNKAIITGNMTQNRIVTISAEYVITQSDYSKTITNAVYTEDDDTFNAHTESEPAMTVERNVSVDVNIDITSTGTADNGDYYTYDTVTYRTTVTNNGNITLTGIELMEELDGCVFADGSSYEADGDTAEISILKPGASVTLESSYMVQESDLGQTVTNSIRFDCDQEISGTYESSPINVSDELRALIAEVDIINTGSGNDGQFKAGDTIKYGITVTNKGAKTYTNVVVHETMPNATLYYQGLDSGSQYTIGTMDGFKVVELEAHLPVKQSDYGTNPVNVIEVKGDGISISAQAEPANIEDVNRSVSVNVATVNNGQGSGTDGKFFTDDTAIYKIDVTNDGNQDLSNLTVTSSLDGAQILNIPEIGKNLNEYTWDDLKLFAKAIPDSPMLKESLSYLIDKEQTKPFNINGITSGMGGFEVNIRAFDHYEKADGSGRCGLVLGLTSMLPDTYKMNSSNIGGAGYGETTMYKTTLPGIFEQLDEELKPLIESVSIECVKYDGSTYNVDAQLFIESDIELFGDAAATITGGKVESVTSSIYEYWEKYNTDADRKMYYKGTSSDERWLRDNSTSSTNYFRSINSSGKEDTYTSTGTSARMTFVFCL